MGCHFVFIITKFGCKTQNTQRKRFRINNLAFDNPYKFEAASTKICHNAIHFFKTHHDALRSIFGFHLTRDNLNIRSQSKAGFFDKLISIFGFTNGGSCNHAVIRYTKSLTDCTKSLQCCKCQFKRRAFNMTFSCNTFTELTKDFFIINWHRRYRRSAKSNKTHRV